MNVADLAAEDAGPASTRSRRANSAFAAVSYRRSARSRTGAASRGSSRRSPHAASAFAAPTTAVWWVSKSGRSGWSADATPRAARSSSAAAASRYRRHARRLASASAATSWGVRGPTREATTSAAAARARDSPRASVASCAARGLAIQWRAAPPVFSSSAARRSRALVRNASRAVAAYEEPSLESLRSAASLDLTASSATSEYVRRAPPPRPDPPLDDAPRGPPPRPPARRMCGGTYPDLGIATTRRRRRQMRGGAGRDSRCSGCVGGRDLHLLSGCRTDERRERRASRCHFPELTKRTDYYPYGFETFDIRGVRH